MSISTRNPIRMVGGQINSGGPNTGEMMHVRGGSLKATVFSGGLLSPGSGFSPTLVTKTADHLILWSGAGRLNSIIPVTTQLALSGVAITAYDSAVAARSGPYTGESGYGVLATVNYPGGVSGQLSLAGGATLFDAPFSSGLAVVFASGAAGVTITWTPEVIPNAGQ